MDDYTKEYDDALNELIINIIICSVFIFVFIAPAVVQFVSNGKYLLSLFSVPFILFFCSVMFKSWKKYSKVSKLAANNPTRTPSAEPGFTAHTTPSPTSDQRTGSGVDLGPEPPYRS